MRIPGNLLKNSLLLLATALILSPACKRAGKTGGQSDTMKDAYAKESIESKVREFVYPLPTVFEVTEMLNEVGANYIISLTNSARNVDSYFTEKSKALNLGVYAADLAYNSTYQQKQETMYYMEAAKKLTDDLGISGVINQDLIKKVEENINNKDQLVDLISNTFYDTYDELNRTGKGNLSLLVISGSWVEALYITTNISENVYHNLEIVKIIYQQRETLNKLWGLFEENQQDEYVQEMINELKPVKEVYDSIGDSLTEDQVTAITNEISRIREKIVS